MEKGSLLTVENVAEVLAQNTKYDLSIKETIPVGYLNKVIDGNVNYSSAEDIEDTANSLMQDSKILEKYGKLDKDLKNQLIKKHDFLIKLAKHIEKLEQ